MTEAELAAARYKATYGDKLWRIQNLYKIRTKNRGLIKFQPNLIQRTIIDKIKGMTPIRSFLLKYRQGGASTLWGIWWLDDAIHHRNTISGILADMRENLGYLWEIVRIAHSEMPGQLRPRLGDDSKSILSFPDLNSKMMVSLGFKSTPLHNLHISEWAFCDATNIAQSLAGASPSTNITGETTPNGVGNDAYVTYWDAKAGTNGYVPIFVPWWLQSEYRLPVDGVKIVRTTEELKLPLDDEQVMFRRVNKTKLKKEFLKYYPEDDETCWLMGGLHYFDNKKVLALLREAREVKPFAETDEFVQWEEYERGCIYAAGADVAEGKQIGADMNRDYSTLCIFNVTKRRMAFRYRGRVGMDVFFKVCDKWGRYYGNALLAVERNNHGHAVLLGLVEIAKYPNLWAEPTDVKMVRVHKASGTPAGSNEVTFGWQTSALSKPILLDQFRLAVEGDSAEDEISFRPDVSILDQTLCEEMLTYEEVDGKLGAAEGKHDDLVMGWAIAYQCYQSIRKRERAYDRLGLIIGATRESATDDTDSRRQARGRIHRGGI